MRPSSVSLSKAPRYKCDVAEYVRVRGDATMNHAGKFVPSQSIINSQRQAVQPQRWQLTEKGDVRGYYRSRRRNPCSHGPNAILQRIRSECFAEYAALPAQNSSRWPKKTGGSELTPTGNRVPVKEIWLLLRCGSWCRVRSSFLMMMHRSRRLWFRVGVLARLHH